MTPRFDPAEVEAVARRLCEADNAGFGVKPDDLVTREEFPLARNGMKIVSGVQTAPLWTEYAFMATVVLIDREK